MTTAAPTPTAPPYVVPLSAALRPAMLTHILQDNVDVLKTLVSFLQQNGNRQAILSETGGGNTASCETL